MGLKKWFTDTDEDVFKSNTSEILVKDNAATIDNSNIQKPELSNNVNRTLLTPDITDFKSEFIYQ